MKFLITEPDYYPKGVQESLKQFGEIKVIEATRKNLIDSISDIDILLICLELTINKEVINASKKLKIIGTASTGLDHIDINYANERNIKIISLKGDFEFLEDIDATFEHTIALLLALIRNIPTAFDSVKRYSWERKKFVGHELKNKTIGILGYGRLGRKVAKICSDFKMNVIVTDLTDENIKKDGFKVVKKESLFKESDIISVHVPLEESTINLVDKEDFALMKECSWIINTSRGKIINDDDLLEALKNGNLAGAAVDVLSTENSLSHPNSNKLIKYAKTHDNLLITPHIAGSTFESIRKTGQYIADKVIKVLNNEF